MVFQSYALYPQMTVKGNLSFGLKNAGVAKDEIERRIARTSEILQIGPLLERKPSQLSGGQRQRVAIGRALVRDVDVFLFDEPLSNLDAKLRSELRVEIKRLHQRLANTMIYVTHDQIEAMTLADRIAVMKGGVIQQLDAPQAIYNRPVNRFVAGFLGSPAMNFLDGELVAGPSFKIGATAVPLARYTFDGSTNRIGPAVLGIRPEHIAFGDAAKSAPFSQQVEVELVEPMGSDTLVWTKLGSQNLSFRVEAEKSLTVGDKVLIGFDPARASIFDVHGGQSHLATHPKTRRTRDMDWSFQLYSARNFQPWDKVLETLGMIGYKNVEGFGGLYDDPARLRADARQERPGHAERSFLARHAGE